MNSNYDNKEDTNYLSRSVLDDSPNYPILFSYCSVDTFYNIVKNKEIWLTDPKFMNDYMEQHYLDQIVQEMLNQIKEKNSYNEDVIQKFCQYYYSYAASSNYFYCCFSSNGDLLSQWCRYADDGCGFSIGFNSKSWKINYGVPVPFDAIPFPTNQLMLNRIHYYSDKTRDALFNFIIRILDLLKNDDKNINNFGSIFSARLCSLINIIKNPAFSEEKEYRIIFNDPSDYVGIQNFGFNDDKYRISSLLESYKFRRKNNSISRYYPLKFSDNFIEQVFIGPKNVSLEKDICDYLKSNGIDNIKIRRSSASYR